MELYSIGHSNHSQETLIALLRAAGIAVLADVRAWPRSRRNPQFNDDALAAALAAAGIAYRHLRAFGGKRSDPDLPGGSPNEHWKEEPFRHYADYALTPPFAAALDGLAAQAGQAPLAMMCAEADWRHCHRQIIADHLVARGHDVVHLLSDGGREAARLNPAGVAREDGTVVYPPRQANLF